MGTQQSRELTEEEKEAALQEGRDKAKQLKLALLTAAREQLQETHQLQEYERRVSEQAETTAAGTVKEEVKDEAEVERAAAPTNAKIQLENAAAEQSAAEGSAADQERRKQSGPPDSPIVEGALPVRLNRDHASTSPVETSGQDPLKVWNPRKERRGTREQSVPGPSGDTGLRTTIIPSKRLPTDIGLSGTSRLNGLAPIPKKQRTGLSASNPTQSPVSSEKAGSDHETKPPDWLKKYARGKTSKLEPGSKSLTISLKKEIAKAKNGSANQAFPLIRDKLHKLFFVLVDEQTVRNNGLLSNEDGLPQIFDQKYAEGVEWPSDMKADAKELYTKWSDRIFETDLLRDIKVGKPKDANKEGADEGGSCVMEGKRVSSKYVGDGKLLNGQWWPTLLCANRDGAHGEAIAGISGDAKYGAYSCFISGGADVKYPDKDHGEVVEYCGTDNKTNDGSTSRGTQMMLQSYENEIPVRFIRSSKAGLDGKSKWAPQCGFRYDGLYNIVDYEVLDPVIGRHRFKLVRKDGQGPIRGGTGPEARPTKEEVDAYNKDKRLRGFKV